MRARQETVTLTESDAWLHGAATLKALPKTDAALTLTRYDQGSASLIAFSGTLCATGGPRCGWLTRNRDSNKLDVEVLAADVFANPAGGYELALDLAGADAYAIAYADVRVEEDSGVVTCTKTGGCTSVIAPTKAEVELDEIGAVWEGELSLEPEGEVEVDSTSFDAEGKKLDKTTAYLGRILPTVGDSFASGHSMLSAGDAGNVGVYFEEVASGDAYQGLVLVSENWTAATAPTHASVALDGHDDRLTDDSTITITGGNFEIYDTSPYDLATPTCANGTCVTLVATDLGYDLSVSEYGNDPAKLADKLELLVTITDASGNVVYDGASTYVFDEAVSVVFANEVGFSVDPLGLDLGGADGKPKTLATGDFSGALTPTDAGVISAPPVIRYKNGKGTRAATTAINGSPGLL